jgi:chromosome partition protein MukE
MMPDEFRTLADAINDPLFPEVDVALRAGRHIDREDLPRFHYLQSGQDLLEPFYRRFQCDLVYASAGYFYLVPIAELVRRRQLTAGEMLVGQTLALMYLEPATLQSGGVVSRSEVTERLAAIVGDDALVSALNRRRKRVARSVAEDAVRTEIDKATRSLAALGFIDLRDDALHLRAPLLRFADPVRNLAGDTTALEALIREGRATSITDAADEDES